MPRKILPITATPFPQLNDPDGRRRIIDPSVNVVVGLRPIMKMLAIRSPITFYRWIDEWGLPAIKRPDGLWMTTLTAIDTWIFLCAELDYKNRRQSRGTGLTPERQLAMTAHLPPEHPRRRRAMMRWQDAERSKSGPKTTHAND